MKEIKFKFWNTIDKCYVKNNGWNGNQDLNEVFIEMQNKYLCNIEGKTGYGFCVLSIGEAFIKLLKK